MQCAGEMTEESLRAAVGTQPLRRHLIRHRAHVEYIPATPRFHVLTEQVTQHRRCVHMQVHDKAREPFAVIEYVAVMIHPGIIDQHLHFDIMRMRVLI